jgi:hypothetical protein
VSFLTDEAAVVLTLACVLIVSQGNGCRRERRVGIGSVGPAFEGEIMRGPVVIWSMTLLLVGGCTTTDTDVAHHAVTLGPPYSDLPPAPAGSKIESGARTVLDARQQEAVVMGVAKWMKDPRSVQFGTMEAARNSRGQVTVCGEVRGRNGTGAYAAMTRYVGVLMGTGASPEFVVVGIAGSPRELAEVASLCRESGASAS